MATTTARQPVLFLVVLAAVGLSFVAGERVGARGAPISSRVADQACVDSRGPPIFESNAAGDTSAFRGVEETSPDCNTDYR